MRSHSYLNTAENILASYDGTLPLAAWLKIFFRERKKFGSTDRKLISHICYCFYRLGHAYAGLPLEDRLLVAVFLCSAAPNILLEELRPAWNEMAPAPVREKIRELGSDETDLIFPFHSLTTDAIDRRAFSESFLVQPELFLRIRPGKAKIVKEKLLGAGIDFRSESEQCLALPNGTKVEAVLQLDEEAVVQDLCSQMTLDPLRNAWKPKAAPEVWDCCAASGGKSILLHDLYPQAKLLVSDLRPSIMHNLARRFEKAGIVHYRRVVHDVAEKPLPRQFDLVLCDAPCSGSGTWARTPEQLYFFKEEQLGHYAELQKKIVSQAVRSLRAGGYFLYITCSVFSRENEEMVRFLNEKFSLVPVDVQYIRGYARKADTLFAAVLMNA